MIRGLIQESYWCPPMRMIRDENVDPAINIKIQQGPLSIQNGSLRKSNISTCRFLNVFLFQWTTWSDEIDCWELSIHIECIVTAFHLPS